MNETIWILFAFLDLILVVGVFKWFGKSGLQAMIVFNLLICNIQVLKTVELFGLTTTLGNVLYASVFLSTDLLSEFYGPKEARKGVFLGFLALVMATIYMQVALIFTPAPEDFAQPHLQAIFGLMPRIAAASLAAYLVSQLHDIWSFHWIKSKTGESHLWLRNNASTIVSQILDSTIFCLIAFWGMFETDVWLQILASTYALKLVMAFFDTPFIYFARRMCPIED